MECNTYGVSVSVESADVVVVITVAVIRDDSSPFPDWA